MKHQAVTRTIAKISSESLLAWMARIGYAARGLVFLIIGGFALLAASGAGARPQGMSDALQTLFEHPFGGVLLWIIAAGLACFAGWRFLQAFFDSDQVGDSLYGLTRRGVFAITGLFYVALTVATVRITFAVRHVSEDQATRDWTQWLMGEPLGRVSIALIAGVFAGVAIGLVVRVVRAPYRRSLDTRLIPPILAIALGSFGILTRAVVFFMIGAFLGFAAYNGSSKDAVGLSGALQTVQHQSYGRLLLAVAAFGLLAFGSFEIIEAVARRVRTPKLPKTTPRRRSRKQRA